MLERVVAQMGIDILCPFADCIFIWITYCYDDIFISEMKENRRTEVQEVLSDHILRVVKQ